MLRALEIPSVQPQELAAMVDLQVGKLTPYEREEIITDWHAASAQREGFSLAIVAIAPRFLLADYFEPLAEFQFNVERVGLTSSGLPYFTPASSDPELLIEVGSDCTEIQVVSNRQILFSRAIPVGEARFSENEAENAERIFSEVKRSLEIAQNEQVVRALPDRAVLLGASRHRKRLQERITQELKMTCRETPPLDRFFKFSSQARQALEESQPTESFYGMLGALEVLPAQHFNLMPVELRIRKGLEEHTRQIVRFGVLAAVLVMVMSLFFAERVQKRRWALEQLDQRYRRTAAQAQEAEKMRGVLDFTGRQMRTGQSPISFLEAVYQFIPNDVYCTHLTFEDGKKFSIRGYAAGMTAVFNFVTELNKSGRLTGVETKYATKRKVQEKELVEFEITGGTGS